jgi:hypothetical protein
MVIFYLSFMTKIIASICFVLTFVSCSTVTEKSTNINGLELIFKESIRIPVDEGTNLESCLIDLIHDLKTGKDILAIYNPQQLSLTKYDFIENEIIDRVLIDESIGISNFNGLRMRQLNNDTILFFNNESSVFTLINSDGIKLSQERLPNQNYRIQYLNYNWSLFEFHQNKLFLNARNLDDYFEGKSSFSVISFHLETKEVAPLNVIPSILNEKYFGLESMILCYSSAYNSDQNIFYHNFGITPFVIEQGKSTRELPIISLYHDDPKAISDLDKEELVKKFTYTQVYESTLKNPRYPSIRFDLVNKLLLRDYYRPSTDDEIMSNILVNPSTIIADLDGNVLGQVSINRNIYVPGIMFFVENGIVLINKKAYDDESDDFFHFDLYEYVKI